MTKSIINDAILKDIRTAIESLEYGTVAITVHDSKIVQIDITERKRFTDVWKYEKGGGI
ncbi:MAG: DUF2292 domain-containing protein [Candidatus Omnitrophota bacterium]